MRRALHTAAGRLNSAIRNQAADTDDTENPIASENNSEVLTLLRSLRQQVSALQASQSQATPQAQVEATMGVLQIPQSQPKEGYQRILW